MSAPKMQHCFNCGKELGVYAGYYGDIEVCGDSTCVREARSCEQAEREEAQYRAAEDDWSAYR